MATYNIFLGNPARMRYRWDALCTAVCNQFDRVAQATSDYDRVRVRSTMTPPTIGSRELLVYILPGHFEAVVAPHFNQGFGGDSDGFTAWNGDETGSEVYVGNWPLSTVVDLVFHEAMHNKLHKTGPQLHKGGGLAASPVRPPLSQANIDLMAPALNREVPQWSGGFYTINDPLRGL